MGWSALYRPDRWGKAVVGSKGRAGPNAERRGSCAGSASTIWDVLIKCIWKDQGEPSQVRTDLMLVIQGWKGHTASFLVIDKITDQRDSTVYVRRRGKEEILADRWVMTVMKSILLMQSSNWGKLRGRSRSSSVSGIHTRAKRMIHRLPSGSQNLYINVRFILEHSTSYFL